MNRRLLRLRLGESGMIVAEAADGFAALAALAQASAQGLAYDLVVTDRAMPGMSGDALLARIRGNPAWAATRVILASSVGDSGKAEDAFDGYLTKPIRRQCLLDCIGQALGARAAAPTDPTPAIPAPTDPAPTDPKAEAPPPGAATGIRILLAEDNVINQQIAVKLLAKAGHAIEVAENGMAAVEAIQRADYDLVLMDIQMPVMGGVEATRRIRAIGGAFAEIPIIAMTAHAMQGARDEYLAAGMSDYIAKPFKPKEFLAMVDQWRAAPRGGR